MIIIAGTFWGCMGLFARTLNEWGFTSIQVVAFRLVTAAIAFSVILAIKEPDGFRINKKDIPLFLGMGIGSVLFFSACYFRALQMMSMAVAAILLYTSPIWVMLMSVLFFKEKITKEKLIALFLSFAGCILVSGMGSGNITLKGILLGLGSGIGYALYSILGTVALRKYSTYVVTTYTFIIAGIGTILICNPVDLCTKISLSEKPAVTVGFAILTGVWTAVLPYLTYTLGLAETPASKAAILATVEPVVAAILGVMVYKEKLSVLAALGIICILSAIVILNMHKHDVL